MCSREDPGDAESRRKETRRGKRVRIIVTSALSRAGDGEEESYETGS